MADRIVVLDTETNKRTTRVFGLILILVGSPFLAIGVLSLVKLRSENTDTSILVTVAIAGLVGLFCVWTGGKMVLGLKRGDGGLFSPFVLRTAGVLFGLMPIVHFLFSEELSWRSIYFLLETGFFFGVSAALFALAGRRQNPVLGQEYLDNEN